MSMEPFLNIGIGPAEFWLAFGSLGVSVGGRIARGTVWILLWSLREEPTKRNPRCRASTPPPPPICARHGHGHSQLLSFLGTGPWEPETRLAQTIVFSAAGSACHLEHVLRLFVSSAIQKCRLLKSLSDHPMKDRQPLQVYPRNFQARHP